MIALHVTLWCVGILFVVSLLSKKMRWATVCDDKPVVLMIGHDDWLKGFRWIPRSINAFLSPYPPTKLFGTNPKEHWQDIPAPNTWTLCWPLHFAWRGALRPDGTDVPPSYCVRISLFRYDYNDKYYTFPALAIKNVRYWEPK